MVSMLLGLILVGGIITMYLSSKRTLHTTEASSRAQEIGRLGLDRLGFDGRMAGFWGCLSDAGTITNLLNPSGALLDFDTTAIGGTDNTGLNGSDSLTIAGAFEDGIDVGTPYMPTPSAALHVANNNGLSQGDIVAVSDCQDIDIFQITNANPNNSGTVVHNTGNAVSPGNSSKNLSKTYGDHAQLFKITQITYSVANGASGQPTLMRNGAELIEGVENLQVSYGVDTNSDGSVDRYLDAGSVADWASVTSLKVSILVRSEAQIHAGGAPDYTYWGNTITPGDGYLRRVFTTVIGIRNRMP